MPSYATKHTAVINGVVAVLVLFAIMKISNDKKILGDNTNKIWPNVVGWLTFVIVRISVIIMFASWANNEFWCIPRQWQKGAGGISYLLTEKTRVKMSKVKERCLFVKKNIQMITNSHNAQLDNNQCSNE